jgi:hypothetical protein
LQKVVAIELSGHEEVYDISVHEHHNFIADGIVVHNSWSADLPPYMLHEGERRDLNANMFVNPNFSIPESTALDDLARTTDGILGGVARTPANLGVWAFGTSGGWSATWDSSVFRSGKRSVKLSTLNTSSSVQALWGSTTLSSNYINTKVQPSTEYTLTAWVKTENTAADGAYIYGVNYNAYLAGLGTAFTTNKVVGTNEEWTKIEATFTTHANASRMLLYCKIGTGAVANAWFADIRLTPTTPITIGSLTEDRGQITC